MLAGGLNPDNALQAAQVGCLGLDFNSGVESAPARRMRTRLQPRLPPCASCKRAL